MSRRLARAGDVVSQSAGLRRPVRGQTDYPLCDSTLRIVIPVTPFPQVGGMNFRTCPRCAAVATEGATVVECARVAERLLEVLTADGLTPLPKTSGSKGLQVYCGVRTRQPERTSAYAKAIAGQLAAELPELVVSKMAKTLRTGRVLIDWSQNNIAKTTIAPYSLRGRDTPTASTPITWDEVRACRTPAELTFTADDVLHRVEEHGDLLADLHDTRVALPDR